MCKYIHTLLHTYIYAEHLLHTFSQMQIGWHKNLEIISTKKKIYQAYQDSHGIYDD